VSEDQGVFGDVDSQSDESKKNVFNIELQNAGVILQVAADQNIYQAALNAGVQLPIGCNYGGCITCAARLVSGQVRQPGASALNKRQSKAGTKKLSGI